MNSLCLNLSSRQKRLFEEDQRRISAVVIFDRVQEKIWKMKGKLLTLINSKLKLISVFCGTSVVLERVLVSKA